MQINLIGPTRIIRIYICLVLMVAQPWALSSQVVKPGQSDVKVTGNGDIDLAEEAFANGDYVTALKNYLSLLKKEPKSEKLNYRVGVCYLNSPFNKSKALPYFLTASKAEKVEPDLWFYLGRAYHLTNKFDEALDCFNKFKKLGRGSSENKKLVDPYIQYVYNAKELMKFPLNVTFSNLGPNVNSNYPDYQAFVPEDESFLVFTSRRKDGGAPMMPNGQYPESVYISKVVNGDFSKAKSIGPPINTGDGDEEVVGLSSTGDIMLLVYDNEVSFADLFIAYADKKMNFKKAEILDKNINSSSQELAACITADGNAIYFSSNRPGGFGGTDLYISRKLPSGVWAPAQNLGPDINTAADEDFPNISNDGQTFYFSSTGHTSMGGYDIFKAKWNESTNAWTDIQNFGYPINTTDDDMNLRLSSSGKYGYISALRDGGMGDLDIYRVDFNAEEQNLALVKGTISWGDTTVAYNPAEVSLSVYAENSNEAYGNYNTTSKGTYVMILPPGKYTINLQVKDLEPVSEKIIVASKIAMHQELNYNFRIEKSNTPKKYVVKTYKK